MAASRASSPGRLLRERSMCGANHAVRIDPEMFAQRGTGITSTETVGTQGQERATGRQVRPDAFRYGSNVVGGRHDGSKAIAELLRHEGQRRIGTG